MASRTERAAGDGGGREATRGPDGADALFAGPGEVRALARALDWGATPLGWPARWSPALRTATRAMLEAPFPICLWAGPEYALVYNDAYRRILAAKHPAALGQPGGVVWGELWAELEAQFARVRGGGPPAFAEDAPFVLARLEGGAAEDAWFSYSLSALRDEDGAVVAVLNIARETTARVRAERAVATERARLFEAFQRVPSFVSVVAGPDHVLAYANEAYFTLVGRRDIVGRPVWEALPDARGQGFEALLDAVRDTGVPVVGREAPLRLVRTPGGEPEERFVDFVYQALADADGARWGVMGHGTDVTDQVRARREVERLLAESEAANAQLQQQALELELSNQQLQDQAAELELQTDALKAAAAELAVRSEDAGEALARAEAARATAAASEARYRTLAEAVPVQVWTARPDGHLDFVSARTAAYFGVPAEEVLGTGWGAFVHPDDLPAARERWAHALATGTPYQAEFRLRGAPTSAATAGAYRWHLSRALAERDAAGTVVGWVGSNTDVEGERAARAEAEAARSAAEAANRAKAEFLATMSHELRTPLNAIGGYAELLELGIRGPVTEQQRVDIRRIQQSQRHLLGLVNEVLDLARVDSGELKVERAAVRAGDTVDAALALVRPQAAAKGLALSEACAGAADRPYLGDEPRVRQVLVNLLANAVKFTGSGGRVAVTCALTADPPAGATLASDTPYLALRVEDTGVGIAPDQLERIFEPFTQAEGGLTRPRGGTGLGLAISRRLARLMGGDLTVESRPGVGSAFTLWLPTPERRASARVGPASRAVARPERDTPPAAPAVEVPGLAPMGDALVAQVEPVLRAWMACLRADPDIPAAGRSDAELEDHGATFLTDVALAVRTMGQPGGEPAALLRDGTAILTLIAERHGAQRARLGWPEAAITREFALLGTVLDRTVRQLAAAGDADDGAAAERAAAVVARLLDQAARTSLGGHRLATGDAGA